MVFYAIHIGMLYLISSVYPTTWLIVLIAIIYVAFHITVSVLKFKCFFKHQQHKHKSGEHMYYSDKPIINNNEDLLDRRNFAKLLANTLVNLKSEDTFTIGMFGKWGTGKTSIVNMALHEIDELQKNDEDKPIVVRFEPWHFTDSTQLLSQFFIRLSNEFKSKKDKNLTKIGKAIEKYSIAFELANLIPAFGGVISSIGKFGVSVLGKKLQRDVDSNDILLKKEHVVKLLSKQKSKIIVIIDDIDRLSNEQIRQVFQLVSSVAKFPNTIYLLVFDKNVVVKALEKVQEGNGEDYLQKVIQMPIQIPEIPEAKMHAVLFNRLNDIIDKQPQILFERTHWEKIFKPCVEPFINNLRDINRLCNALRFKLTTISSEVDFSDMVAISAIEIGMPEIYEWIKLNKGILTGRNTNVNWLMNKKTGEQRKEHYHNELQYVLKSRYSDKELDDNTEIALTCLSHLFPHFGKIIDYTYQVVNDDLFRRNNYIAHFEKFDRYFYFDIDTVAIKRASIEEAVYTLDVNALISLLIQEDKNNNGMEFLYEIKAITDELPSDRAKIVFTALLSCSDKLNTTDYRLYGFFNASSYAQYISLDVLDKVLANERMACIKQLLNDATAESLNAISDFINMIELGYGRLAAEGTERGYKKVITLEELLELEVLFVEKVKGILEKINLFDIPKWRITLHLLKSFDGEYTEKYISNALNDNRNILYYLDDTVAFFEGSHGNGYEVRNAYSDLLTKEKILEAIQQVKKSGELFKLPDIVINKSIAFYLDSIGKLDYSGHVAQKEVDATILRWKENKD